MKKVILSSLLILGIFFVSSAQADWMGNLQIRSIVSTSNGYAQLSIVNPPQNLTCNHWGYEFKFDASTVGGENLYKTLMAAFAMDRNVNLAFTASSAPGTDHNSGCSVDAMSVLENVGMDK